MAADDGLAALRLLNMGSEIQRKVGKTLEEKSGSGSDALAVRLSVVVSKRSVSYAWRICAAETLAGVGGLEASMECQMMVPFVRL